MFHQISSVSALPEILFCSVILPSITCTKQELIGLLNLWYSHRMMRLSDILQPVYLRYSLGMKYDQCYPVCTLEIFSTNNVLKQRYFSLYSCDILLECSMTNAIVVCILAIFSGNDVLSNIRIGRAANDADVLLLVQIIIVCIRGSSTWFKQQLHCQRIITDLH